MITGNKSVYKPVLQFKPQSSNAAESNLELKTSFKTKRWITSTTEDELHILPTDVRLTCPNFTEKTGPTRPTNPEEVVD